MTFFYTWLFIHTGGSVFITIVAHATEGLIGRELTDDDGWTGTDETHWVLLYTAGWCAVALALLAFDWKLWRTRLTSSSPAIHGQPVPMTGPTPVNEQSEAGRDFPPRDDVGHGN